VRGAAPGTERQAARAALVAAAGLDDRVVGRRVAGRAVWVVKQFEAFPTVSASIVLSEAGDTVDNVQLSLPAADGQAALYRAWGEADGLVMSDDQAESVVVWQDAHHSYTWKTLAGDPRGHLMIEAR